MILLDTQVVTWIALEPRRLTPAADAAISKARKDGAVAIADKTLWELAMMFAKGKIQLDTSLRDFLVDVERRFTVLPITPVIAERSIQFGPSFPKDPSDRIIAATAIVHGLKLVTSDKPIRKSGEVACIW